jgi:hypothetical protein
VRKILDGSFEVAGISKTDRIVNNPSAALLEGNEVRIVTPAPGYIKPPTEQETPDSDAQPQVAANKKTADNKATESGVPPQEAANKKSAANNTNTLPYRVGPYRFDVVLEPKEPVVGKNVMVIYLQNEQGRPIEAAHIEAIAKMPAMGSMPATQVPAKIREVRPGIYGGLLELPMEGSWPLTLRFKAGDSPEQTVVLDMATGRSRLAVSLQDNSLPGA